MIGRPIMTQARTEMARTGVTAATGMAPELTLTRRARAHITPAG
jgi:hypothetical protein